MKLKQLLEFEVAFPDEEPKTIEDYLKGGIKDVILNSATFLLGMKSQQSKYNDPEVLLGMFFRKENYEFANEVYDRIKEITKSGKEVLIFNPISSLKLFEDFFNSFAEEEIVQSEAEFEINLFKALLVLNSEFTKKQSVASTSTKDLDVHMRFPMLLFCSFYPTSDKVNYNFNEIWISQFVKSIYLFQFLEGDAATQMLLSEFLTHFGCSTWEEYLKRLLPLTTSIINKEKEAHTDIKVKHGDNFEKDCAFVEKLIVSTSDEMGMPDFLSIRSKPFYKIKEGVYRIIFDLFVVEKIFKGVYFILRDINRTLPRPQRVKELKSLFGLEYSEKVLMYNILKLIYHDSCISFTGDEMDKKGIVAAPDYYVRRGKDILIFESKDFLVPAGVKESFDYLAYEDEFEKKLYFVEKDGVEKPKAVLQLINTIKKLLKNKFTVDSNYNYKEVRIFPVLITHDHQYDVVGLNSLINDWFQFELGELKKEGFFVHKISPLVIVNIDCLIYHQVPLSKDISLHEMIRSYSDHVKIRPHAKYSNQEEAKSVIMSKLIPFSQFLNNYIMEVKWWKIPPIMEELGLLLFDETEE